MKQIPIEANLRTQKVMQNQIRSELFTPPESQHTPAPWKIWRDMDSREPLAIVGPSGDFTATIAMENTQAQANARLIAAAPELLEALQATIKSLEWCRDAYGKDWPKNSALLEDLAKARAAIAKATASVRKGGEQ
jgi:hypothetical protein